MQKSQSAMDCDGPTARPRRFIDNLKIDRVGCSDSAQSGDRRDRRLRARVHSRSVVSSMIPSRFLQRLSCFMRQRVSPADASGWRSRGEGAAAAAESGASRLVSIDSDWERGDRDSREGQRSTGQHERRERRAGCDAAVLRALCSRIAAGLRSRSSPALPTPMSITVQM